jgi:Protein of unknown function DUF262
MSELKTCFKHVDYDLAGLLHYIDIGEIGLPDIQRPFVWSNAKVRDLFDSMYRGFPVGYLLFRENADMKGTRQIGTDRSREAHEQAVQGAGRTFAWHPSEVSPEDIARYGKAYWQDFYDNCLVIGLVCQK